MLKSGFTLAKALDMVPALHSAHSLSLYLVSFTGADEMGGPTSQGLGV